MSGLTSPAASSVALPATVAPPSAHAPGVPEPRGFYRPDDRQDQFRPAAKAARRRRRAAGRCRNRQDLAGKGQANRSRARLAVRRDADRPGPQPVAADRRRRPNSPVICAVEPDVRDRTCRWHPARPPVRPQPIDPPRRRDVDVHQAADGRRCRSQARRRARALAAASSCSEPQCRRSCGERTADRRRAARALFALGDDDRPQHARRR